MNRIQHGPLAALDLNLLVVLDALLRDGSAARAARRLARTPSAISHSLSRLRDAFDDPLFVRVGPSLRPTPRAEALASPLAEILERAGALFTATAQLDPRSLQRTFAVDSSDLLENVAFPGLLAELAAVAPGVAVITRTPGDDMERALQSRELDVAFVTRLRTEAGLLSEELFDDKLALLLRRGHPALRKPMDLDAYCALGHVFVAPRGTPGGPIDDLLARRGRSRHIALRTPSFTAALRVVAATDLATALPRRYARTMRAVVARALPFPEPVFQFRLAWSAALDADPAQRWFRALLRRHILSGYRVSRDPAPAPLA